MELTIMNDSKTLYFTRKKKKKLLVKELSNNIVFDYEFNYKKDTYLENNKYLVVISKKYIRVQIFDINNSDPLNIKNIINLVNS